jgi:hypothetical protein
MTANIGNPIGFVGAVLTLSCTRFGLGASPSFNGSDPMWTLTMRPERLEACPVAVVTVEPCSMPRVEVIDIAVSTARMARRVEVKAYLDSPEVLATCKATLDSGRIPLVMADYTSGGLEVSYHIGPAFMVTVGEGMVA